MTINKVTQSQYYMWRTLFALSHVDNIVSDEEVRFMTEILEDVPFTAEEKAALQEDISTPQNPVEMFRKIKEPEDKAAFFRFANDMVWVDGDFGEEEQKVMIALQQENIKTTDINEFVGRTDLHFETDVSPYDRKRVPGVSEAAKKHKRHNALFCFRKRFLEDQFQDD